jgi:hypothetical protein
MSEAVRVEGVVMAASRDVDLEVLLNWVPQADGFTLTVLYNAPGERDDDRYFGEHPIKLNLEDLDERGDETDVDDYGRLLGEMVFVDDTRATLKAALDASRSASLNLRIAVDVQAPLRYHQIRWETVCAPGSGQRLTTSQRINFSRYLSPARGNRPTVFARTQIMTALVAVANPADVAQHALGAAELAEIEVERELARAEEALGHMTLVTLPRDGRRATRRAIIEELSKGVHVLYLVCHGRVREGRSQLLLEKEDGSTDVVDGTTFANDVGSLSQIPTMVVLCSCESAGTESPADVNASPRMAPTAEGLVAVGPALASAGAAVVVGMQGSVTMSTAADFLRRFFAEIKDHGLPARAMAQARLAVRDRPDWYMPVLYSRLKRGSAWFEEGYRGGELQLFANLRTRMTTRPTSACTPIVGSGIVGEDGVLPSRQELAEQWVMRRQMPIAETSRNDLASVAQFVRVEQEGGAGLVRDEMRGLLRAEMKRRFARTLPYLDFAEAPLSLLVSGIGRWRRGAEGQAAAGVDGYTRLVRLNLPVYVTTSWTSLLEETLIDHGRQPVVRHFDWRKSSSHYPWPYRPAPGLGRRKRETELEWQSCVSARVDGGEEFSADRPLVYHLAGTMEHEHTLVLTEDDCFTWLQEWAKQFESIPEYVKTPIRENSLLFLGYYFDDWEFRMMFEAVKSVQSTKVRDEDYGPHVGVQLEPNMLRIDREAAQGYLESYFGKNEIKVYWQSSNRFLSELQKEAGRD